MAWRWARAESEIQSVCRQRGILRARDLDGTGVSRAWLERLVEFRSLVKVGRGLYALPGHRFSPMAIAAAHAPEATLCLLSALHLHGLLREPPSHSWFAIHRNARLPTIDGACFVRSTGPALLLGVEPWRVEGVPVRVTSVAKTLVDCFRYADRVGEQAGPAALDLAIRTGRCTPMEVLGLARPCRVWEKLARRMWSTPAPESTEAARTCTGT